VKKRQYERFGVSEYWIADPVHRTIDQFLLTDGKFNLFETYGKNDILTSPLLACIRIELNRVFPEAPGNWT
jgi:Uma2 family endonuclease